MKAKKEATLALARTSNNHHSSAINTQRSLNYAVILVFPVAVVISVGRHRIQRKSDKTVGDLLSEKLSYVILVAITWTNAPENQYPILGEVYVVKCEVKADPNPTIDWLRNGDQIRTGDKYVVQTHGLLIRDVQESDDGIYTCRAAVIETGELLERTIRVEVYSRPVITYLPITLEATEGQPFAANCTATGKPKPEISWIKDAAQQNVANADRFNVNPLTGLLTINAVTQDDYGTYTCIAKNDAGVVDQKTKLNVLVRPSIYEMYNVTGVSHKEIALTCRAKGRPAPEITFRHWGTEDEFAAGVQVDDDRIVLEQHFDEDRGESSGTLRISRSMRSDDGLYQCLARNKGDTDYKTGHITIEFPPDFTHMKDLPPIFSWDERKANLSCLAMGIPNATIEWRWSGKPIKEILDKNLQQVGNGPRSDLIVHPVARHYYSVYKCVATNIHGVAEQDIQLKEARVPELIAAAIPKQLTATTITFDIRGPPAELGLPITAFAVQYKEALNPDWSTALNRTWSPESPYIVESLKPQTSYNFRFAARNAVGLGSWGVNLQQSTPRRSAPEEPKPLHSPVQNDQEEPVVVSPYSDHFELRWSVPADNGEPIDFYQVKYCPGVKMAGTWHELENQCVSVDVVESTAYEMSHLSGNTYYRIELRAHNVIGFSSPASIIMKTTRGESDSANNNLGTLLYTAGLNSAAASSTIHSTHTNYITLLITTITSTTIIAAITTKTTTTVMAIATTACLTLLNNPYPYSAAGSLKDYTKHHQQRLFILNTFVLIITVRRMSSLQLQPQRQQQQSFMGL
ncbi:hypothetical protein GQX74_008821 [Glossina fuscipes]|nr:hypothetical protein GQX74_008821 [Glossina fuscipes]